MSYNIDFESMTLNALKTLIISTDLVPSRLMLLEFIDEHFEKISSMGIKTADSLIMILKNKKKLEEFSNETGIDQEYLILLIREFNGYLKQANKWKNFDLLPDSLIYSLAQMKISDTKQYYEAYYANSDCLSPFKKDTLDLLLSLADLSRIRWVNHTFASVLYNIGYLSANDVSSAGAHTLFDEVNEYNHNHKLYKGTIGLRDMERVIHAAKQL